MSAMRTETDSLGPVPVPSNAYYGAQTQRARDNFPVSGLVFHRRFIAAMGLIKRHAALVNKELGIVEGPVADTVAHVANEVITGEHDRHFPLDIFQTGSGTSTNMNTNEVIANRSIELMGGEIGSKKPVHPNDHVNAGQSSNDTIPTAIHVAAFGGLVEELEPALTALALALEAKATEFDDVVKIGRTHLQDAVPVRLGQEFSGYAQQVRYSLDRLAAVKPRLAELALGGTAVGTGLNAPPGFADAVIAGIAEQTGLPFVPAPNRFEALAAKDTAVEVSGALKTIAVSLTKIANDIRWLASGPRCGFGEITIPSLQPGSSIMPGKVNPVIPESVLMVCAQVMGNDTTITVAGASGSFELNVMMPVIAYNLLQSIEILANGATILTNDCVAGIEANADRAREIVEKSLAMCTSLAPIIGYDEAASIAKEAFKTGRTVREIALEREVLPADELERTLDARAMTEGGIQE